MTDKIKKCPQCGAFGFQAVVHKSYSASFDNDGILLLDENVYGGCKSMNNELTSVQCEKCGKYLQKNKNGVFDFEWDWD